MIRHALVIVSCGLLSLTARADGDDALKPGVIAPAFTLPVINDFVPPKMPTGPLAPKQAKWGPGRWTGDKPEESKKLVVMSFFATYCEPCKKEMPELARLYSAYKDQGLGVMLVSIDKGDEQRQTIIDLAKEHGVTFPVMHDRYQVVARRYNAERLPYMLMIDPAGAVKVVHVGYTEELKANLEQEVRTHLGLPPLPTPTTPTTPKPTTPKPTTPKPATSTGSGTGQGPAVKQNKT
jgi:thiol-disulfide isomerase/thioredoxin